MKSVLITGINGLLGTVIFNHLKGKGFLISGLGRKEKSVVHVENYYSGDIADPNFIHSIPKKFDYIIHCAALVNLQFCEEEPLEALKTHVEGTKNIANLLKSDSESTFIYISTDSVFDGTAGMYTENSQPNPLNTYAKTKLLGEKAVAAELNNYYILRLNLFGYQHPMQNSLFEWAFKHLSAGEHINGYKNVIFNPLYTNQIAELISIILNSKIPHGIYNLSANRPISKFDFLKEICKIFNFNENLVRPIEANFENDQLQRPYNTSLDNKKIKQFAPSFNFDLENGLNMLKKDMYEHH